MGEVSYRGHRYPAEIIAHCVWLYHRFPLSFRVVEELMLVRGVIVSYETIRQWCAKFGPEYACRLPPTPTRRQVASRRHRQVIWECFWRSRCEWTGWKKIGVRLF